jgi:cation diffusion facilitator family transporter
MNTITLEKWLSPKGLLWASVVVACITIALKTLAWHLTDSVGLLSDAMESVVNLASAVFGLMMVTVAAKPADEDHPYGHHKAEYFSSGFEGILIVVAALGIIWAASHRIFDPQPLEQVGLGLALSVASSALNGLLAWVMFRAAKTHRSIALEADARHLVTDVWTSAGVVLGIALVSYSGWLWLDAVVAIGVALNILKEGWHLIWTASQGLMDEALESDVQTRISAVLQELSLDREEEGAPPVKVIHFDHVTTRQAGQRRFVDLHMHMPAAWSLGRAAAEARVAARAERRDLAPLEMWVREGYLVATPGNVVDYEMVRAQLVADAARFNIREVAIDPWNATHLATQLASDGFTCVETRQGFATLSAPTKHLETLVLSRKIAHGQHPVLGWCASNVAVEMDPAGNIKPSTKRARDRIDGIVALVMGLDRLGRNTVEPSPNLSVWG